jgi:hypothetical protein
MTNEQKQHLLAYLGYYRIKVDGIWGNGSVGATKEFQSDYGLTVTGIFDDATESRIKEVIANDEKPIDFWQGIKYFKREEFKCKCGKYCDGFPTEPEKKLVTVADRVREHFGKSAIVSSGVRCKQHNANVGGVANSRHLTGKAMDFRVSGKSAKEVLAYAQKQPEIRYAYAIDQNYIHMDIE